MVERIYLDNNASTEIDPAALEAFVDSVKNHKGNPSSSHSEGRALKSLLLSARDSIANYLGVRSKEIIFTSGASEAINFTVKGIFEAGGSFGHIITSDLEHPALLSSVSDLEKRGASVTRLSPGEYGAVKAEAVESAITKDTRLIALMAVNNETGAKSDIEAIAALADRYRIPFVVDGVALFGKEEFTIPPGVSALSVSGHKLHAPKGIGLAYVRRGVKISPLIVGGSHEYGRRAGTENLSGIVAFAAAVERLRDSLPRATMEMERLRDRLEEGLIAANNDVVINGLAPRICNTSNIAFKGVEGELLLALLDKRGIAVSHGSACSSGSLQPSHVLTNMGLEKEVVRSSIRISLSRFTTEEEIDRAIAIITSTVNELRSSVSV